MFWLHYMGSLYAKDLPHAMADHAAPPWDDEWLIPSDDEVEPELALFWSVEKSARILNGAMTPFEKWDLERWLEDGIPNAYQADITKVIRNYGKNRGATSPCKKLIQYLVRQHGSLPGEQAEVSSKMFTLMKHMFLRDRKNWHPQANDCGINFQECSCLAATFLMPAGCTHTRCSVKHENWSMASLCLECSQCIRCSKYLGLIAVFCGKVIYWDNLLVWSCIAPKPTTSQPCYWLWGIAELQCSDLVEWIPTLNMAMLADYVHVELAYLDNGSTGTESLD